MGVNVMNDQAEKLRRIIENLKMKQVAKQTDNTADLKIKNAKVITITSGKGGVGKTNIAVNLAVALSQSGLRVIILDADFGLANIDVLFGIIPKYSLVDVIYGKKNIIEVLSDGPNGVKFISGGSGVAELIKLEQQQLDKFIYNMALLDKIADVIIIDTGAGINHNVMSFAMSADEIILVTTPEPTSITDAYALIKLMSGQDKEKLIKVLVNRADTAFEAEDILKKLSMVCAKFLSVNLEPLGYIINDEMVPKAVKEQQPFIIKYPKSPATKNINDISKKLLSTSTEDDLDDIQGAKKFINRLIGFFKQ